MGGDDMTTTAIGGQGGAVRAGTADNVYLPTRPIVRIHLLGSMRATSYLGDDVLPRSKKARAALAYLCLASGARVPRARLATMLWDRVRPEQARVNLRQAVFDLTMAMGPLAGELISTGRATIRLNTEACWIDALALLKSPYSNPTTRADLAVLCPGELLEGFDDVNEPFGEWLANERIRFKERLASSLDAVLGQVDRGDFDPEQVETVARRLLSFDPAHQHAWNAVIRALAKRGEQKQALSEYERCRQTLEAVRVKPWIETEQLYEHLRVEAPQRNRQSIVQVSPEVHRGAMDVRSIGRSAR